jgi:hypothetical protein
VGVEVPGKELGDLAHEPTERAACVVPKSRKKCEGVGGSGCGCERGRRTDEERRDEQAAGEGDAQGQVHQNAPEDAEQQEIPQREVVVVEPLHRIIGTTTLMNN